MTGQAIMIQNRDLKVQVHNLRKENTELKENYESQIKTLNKKIDDMFASFSKLHEELVTVKTELETVKQENVALRNENNILKQENILLRSDVDRLKKQLNNDSNNSSKPPSSDVKKNIPNNRNKTKNNKGGQKGHKAHFLSKNDVENKIKDSTFNHEIIDVGVVSNTFISKYIIDISVSVNAIEYRFYKDKNGKFNIPKEFKHDVQYGNELKTLCAILNTEGIVAIDRLNDLITSITHGKINMSNGTIVNFMNSLAKKSVNVIDGIQTRLLNSSLMHTDATNARCENRNISVRNYSTSSHTLLKATIGKSKKHLLETNILPLYTGNLCHDHETVMYNYGNKHGECNVHISRYLKGCFENTRNRWCADMKSLLCSLNIYVKKLKENDRTSIDEIMLNRYTNRYDEILIEGFVQNSKVISKFYKKEELKLLNRLKKFKDNHLLFIFDFDMPFDNNLSERDLRHVKSKQKISGYFNSMLGIQNYLDVKSIIGTCKKQKIDFYDTIRKIFANEPVSI